VVGDTTEESAAQRYELDQLGGLSGKQPGVRAKRLARASRILRQLNRSLGPPPGCLALSGRVSEAVVERGSQCVLAFRYPITIGAVHAATIAADHSRVPIIGVTTGPPSANPRIASTA
jgi:hypothetical protein